MSLLTVMSDELIVLLPSLSASSDPSPHTSSTEAHPWSLFTHVTPKFPLFNCSPLSQLSLTLSPPLSLLHSSSLSLTLLHSHCFSTSLHYSSLSITLLHSHSFSTSLSSLFLSHSPSYTFSSALFTLPHSHSPTLLHSHSLSSLTLSPPLFFTIPHSHPPSYPLTLSELIPSCCSANVYVSVCVCVCVWFGTALVLRCCVLVGSRMPHAALLSTTA